MHGHLIDDLHGHLIDALYVNEKLTNFRKNLIGLLKLLLKVGE